MNKAIKYRIYPNNDQNILIQKTFGCVRKVWNLMLSDKKESYAKDKTFANVTPAMYKTKYPFLKEVDSLALANTQLRLQQAIKDVKRGLGFPKFRWMCPPHFKRTEFDTFKKDAGTNAFVFSIRDWEKELNAIGSSRQGTGRTNNACGAHVLYLLRQARRSVEARSSNVLRRQP